MPFHPTDVFVFDAVRTPRGRGRGDGALVTVKPVDLAAGVVRAMVDRHPALDPAGIDDIVLGVVTAIGDQGGNIARAAAIVAGLPATVPGVAVNRFCASGLEAVRVAAQAIASGAEDLLLAGGVESMSRVPMGSDGGAWIMDPATNLRIGFVPQGVSADLLATEAGLTRLDLDAYAVRSQRRAAQAWHENRFAGTIVPVTDLSGTVLLDRDETPRPHTTPESLASLPPAFAAQGDEGGFDAVALQRYHWLERIEHRHTAGNSSALADGAGLVLVGSAAAGRRHDLVPRARILATAVAGGDPTIMLTAAAPAARKALARAGLSPDDLDLAEVNEAFAAVPLHVIGELGLDPGKVNVNGGAIAMGHPLGATGAMLLGALVDELHRSGGRYGLVALCVAGGMGIATVVEALR
ncbi:acetyl-CoA C-acetyltransferase [Plantactinospora sp. WMMB334]|uniref:acetyl-CoA C-acetyltransferase n=1 Tax=Plantactinospora sp. WMMB334 TaxID=3404119 RepID=UPI003B95E9B4